MRSLFSSFLLLIAFFRPFAQQQMQPLKVGDKVPEIVFEDVVNHTAKQLKISDFRGKLLILDFWSAWCASCIAGFPKIEELQEKYRDKLMILPIGFEAPVEGSIRDIIKEKRGSNKPINVPSAVIKPTNQLLQSLFPFTGVPHIIWIDSSGIVLAITNQFSLTEEKIAKVLNGNNVSFIPKKGLHTLSANDPFLLQQDPNAFLRVYGSAFSEYNDTLRSITYFGKQHQADSTVIKLFDVNRTVFDYYRYAYTGLFKDLLFTGVKRIIVESKRNSFYKDYIPELDKMNDIELDNYMKRNLFCYELIVPKPYTMEDAYAFMRSDLDRFFRIKSGIQKRKMPCLSVVEFKNTGKYNPNIKGLQLQSTISVDSLERRHFANCPIDIFVNDLDNRLIVANKMPIVNKTNYKGNINAILSKESYSSLREMKKELNKIGLDLVPINLEMDMLVLQDLRK